MPRCDCGIWTSNPSGVCTPCHDELAVAEVCRMVADKTLPKYNDTIDTPGDPPWVQRRKQGVQPPMPPERIAEAVERGKPKRQLAHYMRDYVRARTKADPDFAEQRRQQAKEDMARLRARSERAREYNREYAKKRAAADPEFAERRRQASRAYRKKIRARLGEVAA